MNLSRFTRNFGFRQTMLLTAGCFVLIGLGVTIVTVVSRDYSEQGARQTETLTREFLPGLVTLTRLQDAAHNLKTITYQFALARDEEAMSVQKEAFQTTTIQVTRSVTRLSLLAHDAPTQRLIAAFAIEAQGYRESAEKFQVELGAGEFEKAMVTLDQQIGPAQQKIETQLDALNERYFQLSQDAGDRTTALLAQSDRFGLLATIVLAGFTLLCIALTLTATRALLAQVQKRDAERQSAQDTLEKRVKERTEELATSLSILDATIDSTADGILALDISGKVVCHNRKYAVLWRVPSEMLERGDGYEIAAFAASQVKNPEHFISRIGELVKSWSAENFDLIELKDGRIFERYALPQRAGGEIVGIVLNFRDVTERKRGEVELENVHQQLLETSRAAGMAEVATSVLHNVGNVLNSVNVSATLVAEGVKQSKARGLVRVVALLDRNAADLGAFIGSDPQGQKLPAFLRHLSEQLIREQKAALSELQSLRENIEHIKDIVAMQQSHARVSGVVELLEATVLVEDSLRINGSALTRHGIRVVREYHEAPPIRVEKHKVLQILVNLIRNAKYACDEAGGDDKRITLRVEPCADTLRISVSDNGIGIPVENRNRIFNHGFTTRKDGHGFGLHSGALAATELGGSLSVHSDGPMAGATFTLELPLTATGSD